MESPQPGTAVLVTMSSLTTTRGSGNPPRIKNFTWILIMLFLLIYTIIEMLCRKRWEKMTARQAFLIKVTKVRQKFVNTLKFSIKLSILLLLYASVNTENL
jgi:hypothetical protein